MIRRRKAPRFRQRVNGGTALHAAWDGCGSPMYENETGGGYSVEIVAHSARESGNCERNDIFVLGTITETPMLLKVDLSK
ncbi:hypothetical protein GGD55_002498 [Rhizobium giardinii]|uniref:Uncharacterized protein n=1 Tax=Rhizobium giardinii TaxID=56731 RepID=A0A7W8UBL4_9HYPH|nr:hypothetical protein [Rhizobium giardinii]